MKKQKNIIAFVSFAILFFVVLVNVPLFADETQEPQKEEYTDQCIICHQEDDNLPEDFNSEDVHIQEGLSCAGCHGGNPNTDDEDLAMDESAGFRGVPDKKDIPRFCGRCHSDINFMRTYQPEISTDQEEQYWQSLHGKKLAKGDQKVADCTSCHTAHSILPASDPRST
ncbi:MAG: hypothetical protein D6748_00980, partial [Calditrichaeota bacterium]